MNTENEVSNETEVKNLELHDPTPINWFLFYTFFRMPAGVLVNLKDLLFSHYFINQILYSLQIILCGIVFVGLLKRRFWGFVWNFVLLIFGLIYFPYIIYRLHPRLLIHSIVLMLIFTVLNFIYFFKRRHMFSK